VGDGDFAAVPPTSCLPLAYAGSREIYVRDHLTAAALRVGCIHILGYTLWISK
jgi:hypothetical protein